ncbi:K02A2.6-like [Cordylochernes scorpioides]|uniref:K02A2.6-like n=1 Tax=Cordylochernes scorpioides TaxID=51811 RepID=A0ABY6LTN6_9ARAC|nr:K02A2.6-like [Cordylochernes scorpioides]
MTETHTPLEKARKLAIERTIKSHEHSKQLYDIKHPEPIFKEGDQIRGSPMGSPLSSPLAEIVMSTLDTWIQQQFTPGIHIWRRYIDDILCICETEQENSILSVLNSFHPDISFSFESEANNVIPFLDILIIRTPPHYHTTVYHKINNPTFYTNFKSFCPLSHKINTVRTLTKRLVTHCSLPIFRSIEFSNIKKQLALSQYPHHFIYKYQYNPAHMKPKLPHLNTCILPYSTQSAAISHLLKPHGINTYYTNNKSLATILRHPITRLPRPASVQSSGGSVYSVSCNDCSGTYIGETGRSVAIRMIEHGSRLGEIFARFVLPEFLVTDNGRQFVSGEFEQFTKVNGIQHTKTKPYNPSTNGLYERYVRRFKIFLRKNYGKDYLETYLQRILFAHRAFPQTVIKEFPRGIANEEKFEINIFEFNTKIGIPREVFHEAVRSQKQFTTDCEVYFRNYANRPKWKKDTVIPELSIRLIKASIIAEDGECFIEENNRMIQTNGLRLARSLLTVMDRKTHIWITNPYPRSLKIMKDQTLAYGSLPAEVKFIEKLEQINNDKMQFQINENLPPKEQEKLKQILIKYADLFSPRLGKTNLAKHRIDTEDAKPIKYRPYSVSPKERDCWRATRTSAVALATPPSPRHHVTWRHTDRRPYLYKFQFALLSALTLAFFDSLCSMSS